MAKVKAKTHLNTDGVRASCGLHLGTHILRSIHKKDVDCRVCLMVIGAVPKANGKPKGTLVTFVGDPNCKHRFTRDRCKRCDMHYILSNAFGAGLITVLK